MKGVVERVDGQWCVVLMEEKSRRTGEEEGIVCALPPQEHGRREKRKCYLRVGASVKSMRDAASVGLIVAWSRASTGKSDTAGASSAR